MKLFQFVLVFFSIPFHFVNGNNAPKKPNLVFILADDCTHWDIGSYGSKDSKTPHIDQLAKEGIQFNRCYQAAPMCSPTRQNIYTGMYPVKSGAYPNHTRVKDGTKSMAHYLKPLGYRVAQIGKKHFSPEKAFPFEFLGTKKEIQFDKISEFLKNTTASKEPFALIICSNEPHTPWNKGDASLFDRDKITLPPHFVDTEETRIAFCNYLAEINYLDAQVGQTLALLEEHNLVDNTLVVFASEQGNSFPFAKWTLYEAGVKSGLIVRMPNFITPGSESDAIVEYTDILPTFIEMAGGEIPTHLDGKSLVPIFKNPQKKIKQHSFSIQTTKGINHGSEYYGIRAVVNEQYRYIWNLTPEVEFLNTVNNNSSSTPWFQSWLTLAKMDKNAEALVSKYKHRPAEELYDIQKDPWCQNNLAGDLAFDKIKNELRNELENWMETCGDKGQQTELEAKEHMPRYLRKK